MPAQNVFVVNPIECKIDENSDLTVKFPDSYLKSVGDTKLVNTAPSNSNTWVFAKPNAGYFNVHVCCALITDPNTSFSMVLPLGSDYYNLNNTQIGSMESGFQYLNVLYPSTYSCKVIYTKIGNDMVADTVVYSLQ